MSRVVCDLPVSRHRAWLLLEDPRSPKALVVGARSIRRFDPAWPEIGSAIHHTVGIYPLVVLDKTVVSACEPGRLLVLDAHLRPFGRFEIRFELEDRPGGCRLTVDERPTSGPVAFGPLSPLVDLAVGARNLELRRRLRRLVQRRQEQADGVRRTETVSAAGA